MVNDDTITSMENQSERQENRAAKYIVGTLILLFLLASAGYAYYTMVFEPANEDGLDIEEGDIVSDLGPLTGVPYSGEWTFKLDIGNPGTAAVTAAPDGSYVVMNVDGQTIFFYNISTIVPYTYRSNPRAFQLKDGEDNPVTGQAYYEFTAADSDVIDGILYHDTYTTSLQSYAGQRAFHMELVEIGLPYNNWIELLSGDWDIDYHDAESDCNDGVASFPDLADSIHITPEYDLDTGTPTGDIYGDIGGDVFFGPGNVNTYTQNAGSVEAGIPMNEVGDIMLDYESDVFTAEYEFYGIAEDDIEGTVTITGSNGCGYTVGFTGSFTG